MKVSLNWVKKFTDVELPIEELLEKIGAQLGAVEEVTDLLKKYDGATVVKVVSCEKHSDADKLSVCLVDDSGFMTEVERNSDGLIQIVCGAPNVKADMLAVWLPPGMVVPATADKDPFTLEAREIRGVVSNGMLASAKELGIGDSHEGILEIDEEAQVGIPFEEVYDLEDYIIDIENKMFTHRPDCFGMLGIAREISGIQGQAFTSPDWYKQDAEVPAGSGLELEVKNEVQDLVPRFCAVAISGIEIKPSPIWLQSYLSRVGVRPINNIVDITNYYMLLTAQPLHAYDYDKLKTGVLGVRKSKDGEKLTLLGGKELKLREGAVVITDGDKPVGLGGVMGGGDTEVDNTTKNIVLEVATFDMNATRKTAMTYGLFTDAATRFTKGQSPLQNLAVLAPAIEDIEKMSGGKVASAVQDDRKELKQPTVVELSSDFINSRLGLELAADEITKLLQDVEFEVEQKDEQLAVVPPFWRTDIEIPEDIVEEVGRLYGYDRLPLALPTRDLKPAELDPLLSFKARVRDVLSADGANEVLTYSFVHGNLLKKAGQNADSAYQVANALSPDLQYYRLSLTPSLLEKIHPNIKNGFEQFALFELGKSHVKGMEDDGLPREFERLALVVAADKKAAQQRAGSAYYQAREYLTVLARELGLSEEMKFEPLDSADTDSATTYYAPGRSATVRLGESVLGRIGEYKASVAQALKLPAFCAGFEVSLDELLKHSKKTKSYQPLPRFPKVEQDMTLRVKSTTSYSEIFEFLGQKLDELKPKPSQSSLIPLDIYQQDEDNKHVTFRLQIASYERTLTAEEVNKLLDDVAAEAKTKLGADRI